MGKQLRSKSGFLAKINNSYRYLKTSWSVQTKEFFENSSLHGVKYISATDRPFIERFMWFICVTTGTIATGVVIFSLWDKFQTNPTITGLDTDYQSLQLFPAITLCPEEPASFENIRNVLGILENASSEDEERIQFYYDLSRLSLNTIPKFSLNYQDEILKFFNISEDPKLLIFKLMNKCDDIFDKCKFRDEIITCCQNGTNSFYPVLTENGLCYTFNSRHVEIRNPEGNVEFNMQYIKETDMKWSLEFSANFGEVLTSIYIVSSDDLIGIDLQPQLIWDYKVNKMSFSVKQTYTTEDTRQLSIKQRRCVFEDEIKLKVDKMYTYTACTIQCRMETIRKRCACVPFFYPEVPGFKYCTLPALKCLANNLAEIRETSKCDCQLGCKNTVYEVEAQSSNPSYSIFNGSDNIMELGFVSWPMVRYKREVLFGWVDLLVSFGGIAGLFLGFSLLSGVEILYYFTIRACIAAFRERRYLDRIRKETEEKPQPIHDLSLVPYFISEPLPGHGIDLIVKSFVTQKVNFRKDQKPQKTRKIKVGVMPPFGIEFVH